MSVTDDPRLYMAPPLQVGRFYDHTDDGLIYVTDGYYLDPIYHRVSNFFHWTVIATGEKHCGYGGYWLEVRDFGRIGLAMLQSSAL